MLAEGEVLLENAVPDECPVEQHFEEVVGIVVVKDDSFSETAGIVAEVVDGAFPEFDEFHNVGSKFAEVVDVLKYNFELVLPAFAGFLRPLPIFVVAMLVGHLSLALGFPLLLDGVQTLLYFQFLEASEQAPEVVETGLPGLDGLLYDIVGILFLGHVLDFGKEDLMHAGVRVGVGELEEVVAVEVRHLLPEPLVLDPIQVSVEDYMFPVWNDGYLLSSACIF